MFESLEHGNSFSISGFVIRKYKILKTTVVGKGMS
jgi:hypothetical protein